MQSDFALVIDKRPVKNFWKGRGGFLPIAIVERMMQGSIEDAEQYFNGRSPEGVFAVSAHYGIARDGRVWQFVEDEDTAWSNGVLQNPDLSIDWLKEVYQEKVNCNLVTLSVDYEGYSGEPLTPRQYEAALALHRQLVQTWDIEADNHHIIGHNWIDSLERSHNPGPLFPFNQLIRDLHADPAEAAQPAPPNPLAFLETPMPETDTEVLTPPVVETESVATYQPETVEEPAYRPQVEAFTLTPDLNNEVDQVTETPTEVDPTTAEPEPIQTETFQATAAYQPEEVQPDMVYQPEELHPDEVQPESAYLSEAVRPDEAPPQEIQPDAAAYQPEELKTEAAYQPEPFQGDIDDIEADLAYHPRAAQPETVRWPSQAPAANQTEAAQADTAQPVETQPEVEATRPDAAEAGEVDTEVAQAEPAYQPAVQPEENQAVDQPEALQAEDTLPETAYQPEDFQPEENQAEEYQVEAVEPEAVQVAPAFEPENLPEENTDVFDAPGQPENLTQLETAAFEAAEPIPTEPFTTEPTGPEMGAVESAQSKVEYLAGVEPASSAEEQAETATPDSAEPTPVENEAAETAQVIAQPETDLTDEMEAAVSSPIDDIETIKPVQAPQAEPEAVAKEAAGPVESEPGAIAPETPGPVYAENEAGAEEAGQTVPEAAFEETAAPAEALETPPETVPAEQQDAEATPEPVELEPQVSPEAELDQAGTEVAAPEPAIYAQDDWAADIFADEFIPDFGNEPVPPALEPSVRDATISTDQLEVSPAIGNDITPKYSRPEFFDQSYLVETVPVEATSMAEVFEAPASDETASAVEVAQPESELSAAPLAEEVTAAEPESPPEATPLFSEEAATKQVAAESLPQEAPVEETLPIESFATEAPVEPLVMEAEAAAEAPAGEIPLEAATEEDSASTVEENGLEGAVEKAPQAEEAGLTEAAEAGTAPQEAATGDIEPTGQAQEATLEAPQVATSQQTVEVKPEIPSEEVARPAPAEPEKHEEKHHWYDRLKNLFGGHDDKQDKAEDEEIQAQPAASPGVTQAVPSNQVETVAPEAAVEAAPVQAEPEPAEPETYRPDYAAEQEIFRSDTDAQPGTVEAATDPALFDAETTAETEPLQQDYATEPAATETETVLDTAPAEAPTETATEPESRSEIQAEPAAEAAALEAQPEADLEGPVNPPVETPQVEETFYPFELDTPGISGPTDYYRSGETEELSTQSSSYDFGLESPAPSYSQDYNNTGPSDYPFELPTPETQPGYLQSFAPPAPPVEEPPSPEAASVAPEAAEEALDTPQPVPETAQPGEQVQPGEPVIPPFSFEPDKAGEEPTNLFDTNLASAEHPKFAYDDLELPAWLNDPETYQADTEPDQPAKAPPQEPATPPTGDFAWASGSGVQENTFPGWLQDTNEENAFPDWLKEPNETAAAPEASQPAAFKDNPAVEIPNKDWQENENLFEDDDFFSLLNQSGLDLSLERGGTGTLPSTGPLPTETASPSPERPAETPPMQPQAARQVESESAPAASAPAPAIPEPEFDNIFDEVEPAPPSPKMTVRQLIDRNDGYTAPLSYEDLDMSVPFGLEEDVTMPGNSPSAFPGPAASSQPVQSAPAPARTDPPGFHRVGLGEGQTSVELANIRSMPSYDKNTVVRVSEQGERFEFDGWIEGPEPRGSTRWYHIARTSGDQWIHSTLVQLDRPFRG